MGISNRFAELDGNGAPLRPTPAAVVETARNLMWGPTLPREMTWEEAKKACADFRLFGFKDWRLPTIEELFGLADRSRYNPAIDADAFPDTKSAWYWSATPHHAANVVTPTHDRRQRYAASPSDYAWGVHFASGNANYDYQSLRGFVRPVRSVAMT